MEEINFSWRWINYDIYVKFPSYHKIFYAVDDLISCFNNILWSNIAKCFLPYKIHPFIVFKSCLWHLVLVWRVLILRDNPETFVGKFLVLNTILSNSSLVLFVVTIHIPAIFCGECRLHHFLLRVWKHAISKNRSMNGLT